MARQGKKKKRGCAISNLPDRTKGIEPLKLVWARVLEKAAIRTTKQCMWFDRLRVKSP